MAANPFSLDLSQGTDPRALQGLSQSLAGLGQVVSQKREQESAQARKQQVQADMQAAIETGDPAKISEFMRNNPEQADSVKQSMGFEDEMVKTQAVDFMKGLLASPDEQWPAMFRERIEMLESQGRDPSDTIKIMQSWANNPAQGKKGVETILAMSDQDAFEAYQQAVSAGEATMAEQLKQQEIDIKRETLNMRKLENESRRDETALDRETNELKRDELKLKIDQRRSKIDQGKQKIQEAAQAAYDAVDSSMATVDRLLEHPGLEAAVGASSALYTIPGSSKADFEAELESFEAQIFTSAVKQMKGLGALSEAEGRKISAAAGAINPRMSESAFKKSLQIIKDGFEKAKASLQKQGIGSQPQETQTLSDEDLVSKYAQ